LGALELGSMITQGAGLTAAERVSLATYLSSAGPIEHTESRTNVCPAAAFSMSLSESSWNGMGRGPGEHALPASQGGGFGPRESRAPQTEVGFGFPGQNTALAQPVVGGGRLFFGSAAGTVYSLDTKTGCEYWTFKGPTMARTAISIEAMGEGRYALYFGDVKANVYALDAETGKLLWQNASGPHPTRASPERRRCTTGACSFQFPRWKKCRRGTSSMLAVRFAAVWLPSTPRRAKQV